MGSHYVFKLQKITGILCAVKAHKKYFLLPILGKLGQNHEEGW